MASRERRKTSRATEPAARSVQAAPLEILPVTQERWGDLERLFGRSGAYSGCWCMYWRVSSNDFAANGNTGNRDALKEITDSGVVPGLLAYRGTDPVGWISIAPREEFGRLQRSPKLKPVDDRPVWSIVCFFVHRDYRRSGVAQGLLEGAISYAGSQGATLIEAYPPEHEPGRSADASVYMGTVPLFTRAGFREVARRSPKRPILRLTL